MGLLMRRDKVGDTLITGYLGVITYAVLRYCGMPYLDLADIHTAFIVPSTYSVNERPADSKNNLIDPDRPQALSLNFEAAAEHNVSKKSILG
ncbi:hypothetical protein BDR05DRAFT_799295 [Suillus weaverae]|nr:hypothetical protein BDR05DRAFT_799295 [Suillus weaverae]